MTEYIDGLYLIGEDSDSAADVLYNGQISSGYSNSKGSPSFQKVVEVFYDNSFDFPWFESADFDEFLQTLN